MQSLLHRKEKVPLREMCTSKPIKVIPKYLHTCMTKYHKDKKLYDKVPCGVEPCDPWRIIVSAADECILSSNSVGAGKSGLGEKAAEGGFSAGSIVFRFGLIAERVELVVDSDYGPIPSANSIHHSRVHPNRKPESRLGCASSRRLSR